MKHNATEVVTQEDTGAVKQSAKSSSKKKAKPLIPFDQLPIKGGFGTPSRRNPYHTARGEAARADARNRPHGKYLKDAAHILLKAGISRDYKDPKYHGSSEHNAYTLAAAMYYAECGLYAIDCHGLDNNGYPTFSTGKGIKHPRGAGWPDEATTDRDKLIARWSGDGEYPADKEGIIRKYAAVEMPRNVGLTFPPGCGMFVLDEDGETGMQSVRDLEAKHGKLPKTWTSVSGSGGQHRIFRARAQIHNSSNEIGPKIDIRGKNGCIVAAPSVHPSLGYYQWAEGCAPGEIDCADAPEWLVAAALEASKQTQAKTEHGRRLRPEGQAQSKVCEPKEPSGNSRGFEAHLSNIGDHAGGKGFNAPIYSAACSWFSAHGADADDSELLTLLREAIATAKRGKDRRQATKYDTESYLLEQIENARRWFAEVQEQATAFESLWEDACEAEGEEDTGPADAGQEPASAGEFESTKDWLPDRYRRLGDKMYRKVPKSEMDAWAKACEEAKENGNDEPKQPEPVEICGAFDVVGRSSNADGTEGAGRVISFEGENGKRVEVTLSLAEIRSDPKAVFDVLSDRGLWLPVGKNAKINLQMLLNTITPKRQIPIIESPGWVRNEHGEVIGYMLPTGEYMTNDGVGQMRLAEGARFEVVKPRGDVDKFTAAAVESFKYTETNFYWPLGLAAGFAGPLLGILKERSCGIVYSGHSTLGKSLGQELGASVFGSPEEGDGGFHSAKTTTNAIEDLCVITTHTTFMFDEIGAFQDKKHLETVLFGMAVGVSKARKKDRNIGLAQRVKFNPFVVMSSEFGIKQEIESGGGKYRDGLVARFPDIDVGNDGVHVSKDKRSILEAVRYNYGHAGPVMVRYMIDSGIAFDRQKLADEVDAIISELSEGKPPVIERAAKPFAIVFRGGQIAADAGVLGDPDRAKTAIKQAVLKAWDVFSNSDEASAASGGGALLDAVLSKMNGMWDRTIIKAGEVLTNEETGKETIVGSAAGDEARGTPIGWYDDEFIYLDYNRIAKPAEVFGVNIKRPDLVNVFGKAVVPKSTRETPQSRLPAHVAQAAGGDGRAIRNLKLKRAELGM
ncbi:bifunctional DNA primase/polymerase [Shimia biformata]|uniref:bifunctional DNA primase/polymerase n=1 Tax=Shimia biformata TaxID=1294299 RepID=UPI001952161C|nr:bifunctional DNA primase/polymerase [Shimia biformata]